MGKRVALLFIVSLTVSILLMVNFAPASAQSNPSVPDFTLKYVDYSYDVPPTTTSTTAPYTNETTTTTVPGYRVENKTIEVTIINNIGASYYNFRCKGHYENEWKYHPFKTESATDYEVYAASNLLSDFAASASECTIISLTFLPESIPENDQVDVQVQALFGGYSKYPSGMLGGMLYGGETCDYHFEGTTSEWSETQTIRIGESQTASPEPTTPTSPPSQENLLTQEQSVILGLTVTVVVLSAGLGLLIYLIKRK